MPPSSHTAPALVLFDVDGTLTRSTAINGALYARALADVFDIRDPRTDWSGYRETTDPGVLRQLFRQRRGRDPSAGEQHAFRERFQDLIRETLAREAGAMTEVPGARALLAALAGRPDWRAAVASGAFEGSVLLKLAGAGLDIAAHLPRATGDDARRRDAILRLAVRRAGSAHGVRRFAAVVAVGDAPWDVRAARALAFRFVGVGSGESADALRRAGARQVIPDYADAALVWEALTAARRPADTRRRHARSQSGNEATTLDRGDASRARGVR